MYGSSDDFLPVFCNIFQVPVCVCMYVCMFVCMYVLHDYMITPPMCIYMNSTCMCMYVCMYVCMCYMITSPMCIYINIIMYVCIHTHTYVHVHTYIHTYMYTQTHLFQSRHGLRLIVNFIIHTYVHVHTNTPVPISSRPQTHCQFYQMTSQAPTASCRFPGARFPHIAT